MRCRTAHQMRGKKTKTVSITQCQIVTNPCQRQYPITVPFSRSRSMSHPQSRTPSISPHLAARARPLDVQYIHDENIDQANTKCQALHEAERQVITRRSHVGADPDDLAAARAIPNTAKRVTKQSVPADSGPMHVKPSSQALHVTATTIP
jgi:hypothetical protein